MEIDWTLYEEDARKLYLLDRKSAAETAKELQQKHGGNIAEKHVKDHFRGQKYLKLSEWVYVDRQIKKRSDKGEEYAVYQHGRRLEEYQVEAGLSRNKRRRKDWSEMESKWNTISDEIDHERIQVCTPITDVSNEVVQGSASMNPQQTAATGHGHPEHETPDHRGISSRQSQSISDPSLSSFLDLLSPSLFEGFHVPEDFLSFDTSQHLLESEVAHDFNDQGLESAQGNISTFSAGDNIGTTQQMQLTNIIPGSSTQPFFKADPRVHQRNLRPPLSQAQLKLFSTFFWEQPGIPRSFSQLIEARIESSQLFSPRRMNDAACRNAFHMPPPPTPKFIKSAVEFLERLLRIQPYFQMRMPFQDQFASVIQKNKKTLHQFLCVMVHKVTHDEFGRGRHLGNFLVWTIDTGLIEEMIEFMEKLGKQIFEVRLFCSILILSARGPGINRTLARPFQTSNVSFFSSHPALAYRLLQAAEQSILFTEAQVLLQEFVKCDHLEGAKFICHRIFSNDILQLVDSVSYVQSPEMVDLFKVALQANTVPSLQSKLNGALRSAIAEENLTAIKALLDVGVKPHLSPEVWEFLRKTNQEIFQVLFAYCASDQQNAVMLTQKAEHGNNVLAQFLADCGMIGNDEFLERGLCFAIVTKNIRVIKTLLKRGVDPNCTKYRHSLPKIWNHDSEFNEVDERPRAYIQERVIPFFAGSDHSYLDIFVDRSGDEFINDDLSQEAFHLSHPVLLSLFYYRMKNQSEDVSSTRLQYTLKILWDHGARPCITLVPHWFPDLSINIYRSLATYGYDTLPLRQHMLTLAIDRQDFGMCVSLCQSGLSLDSYNDRELTPIQHAAFVGDLSLVMLFLDHGADVNFPAHEKGGLTALQASLKWEPQSALKHDLVDFLLQSGASPRSPPAKSDGFTTLESAASSPIFFDKLRALGADVRRPGDQPGQLLHCILARHDDLTLGPRGLCCHATLLKHVETCLKLKANVEDREYVTNRTALQTAASYHDVDAVRLLLQYGADTNAPSIDQNGTTALHATLRGGQYMEILELLLREGASIEILNGRNTTPLTQSVLYTPGSVDFLLQNGANVNPVPNQSSVRFDDKGWETDIWMGIYPCGITPLQAAIVKNNIPVAKKFLALGADPNLPAFDLRGTTTMDLAAGWGSVEMMQLLLGNGMAINDLIGAIEIAQTNKNWVVADRLRSLQKNIEEEAKANSFRTANVEELASNWMQDIRPE